MVGAERWDGRDRARARLSHRLDRSRRHEARRAPRCRSIGGATRTPSERSASIRSKRWRTSRSSGASRSSRPAVAPQIKVDVGIVPDSEFPQFWPPIEPGLCSPISTRNSGSADDVDERGERLHVRRGESNGRDHRARAAAEGSRARWLWAAQCRVSDQGRRKGHVPRTGAAQSIRNAVS